MNFYDLNAKAADGRNVSMREYAGKVVLVVNTATRCGFTPQYEELEALYDAYKDQGLCILDFPCNQFYEQAPESNEEIHAFCKMNFGVKFPIFAKTDVNGEAEAEIFTYLKAQKGFAGFDPSHPLTEVVEGILEKLDPDYRENANIKWNFTKFLIDREGNVVERYEPMEDIAKIREKIETLL